VQGKPDRAMKFPVMLKHRGRVLARIYAKTASHPYRLYWRVKGKSRIKDFRTYAAAKQDGDTLIKELADGSQVALDLTTCLQMCQSRFRRCK
jgi:hypothetical protein